MNKRKATENEDDAQPAKRPRVSGLTVAGVTQVAKFFWVVVTEGSEIRHKIAAFDMDSTIVSPKSLKKNGKPNKFPNGRGDWRWFHPINPLHAHHNHPEKITSKLKQLHNDGYRIVFITNQAGIVKGKTKIGDITGKIQDISKRLGIPISGCISGAKDKWRKPCTNMWDHFIKEFNGGAVDMKASMYIGDAAGREKRKVKFQRARDFSASDMKFAFNLGLKFDTPEVFFYGEAPVPRDFRSLHPVKFYEQQKGKKQFLGKAPENIVGTKQEMIVMVGLPASGKSTFAKKHFVANGYEWINRDTLKTKCKKVCVEALKAGRSAVIDNTNPSKKARGEWLQLARKHGIACRLFMMMSNKEQVFHLNGYRQRMGGPRVPDVAIHTCAKRFEKPGRSEGFDGMFAINFIPKFENEEQEKIFKQFI